MTRKKYRKKLRKKLRKAYMAMDAANFPSVYGENDMHRAIGRYYGLRTAYAMLTGKTESRVGEEVVSWYVSSEHYEREKEREHETLAVAQEDRCPE